MVSSSVLPSTTNSGCGIVETSICSVSVLHANIFPVLTVHQVLIWLLEKLICLETLFSMLYHMLHSLSFPLICIISVKVSSSQYCTFLGVFAKLRIATISSVMSVRPSAHPPAWNNSASNGLIITKLDIWVFFENISSNVKFDQNLAGITCTLHKDRYFFRPYLAQFLE